MKVVFDAAFLILLFDETVTPPLDPATGKPVERAQVRIAHLVQTLERSGTPVIVPTPALSELLVKADEAGSAWLDILSTTKCFQIIPFDTLAAVEAAAATRQAMETADYKAGLAASKQKVKFDRQIVAIAKVQGAERIYSNDSDIAQLLGNDPIEVIDVASLELPPEDAQMTLLERLEEDEGELPPEGS